MRESTPVCHAPLAEPRLVLGTVLALSLLYQPAAAHNYPGVNGLAKTRARIRPPRPTIYGIDERAGKQLPQRLYVLQRVGGRELT